jgi:manganese/zinc/iron transport system substrate-binding protein
MQGLFSIMAILLLSFALTAEDEIGISDIDDTIDVLMEYKIPAVFVESSINQNSIKAVIEGAEKKGLM